MKRLLALTALAIPVTPVPAASCQTPVPATFESTGPDRKAIETLLDTYTRAVSSKNQALFETLLLNRSIPFSGVPLSSANERALTGTANYVSFRKAVFEGRPFTQRFRDVHVQQDGSLAQVSLVFVNTTSGQSTWGWKTMQLVKLGGKWKIAAEFFTSHA